MWDSCWLLSGESMIKNVSGYVCNHGSPSGERDTASPRGRYGERPQRDSVWRYIWKNTPVGRRQPMTSLPAYHNISAAGRIHHQLLRLKLASEAWLKAQGTQCLVPHSGNHGYIRNLRRSPSWELELRPLGVATGNVIPTSPCWGECKPISQKRRALSQLYPA